MNSPHFWFAFYAGAFAEAAVNLILAVCATFKERKYRLRVVFIGLCAASALVMSQSTPGGASGAAPAAGGQTPHTYGWTADSITQAISTKVGTKLEELRSNSTLQSGGRLITAFLLVALLVWTTVKNMAAGKGLGELIGEWVPIFISFGVVNLFLDKNAAGAIESTMDNIAAAIAGSPMSSLDSAIRAGAEPIFKAIAAVISQPRAVEGANVTGGLSGFAETMVATAASWIMGGIAKVIAAFCLILAGVVMTAHIIMGFISVSLVLALAPVMVPFLMFRPLEFLFSSWLRFLLGACMLKVVVAFLLTVAAALLSGMTERAAEFYRDSWQVTAMESLHVDILMLGMTMVFALLAMFMLMQAPAIANGLLSGSGAMGFGGLRGLTHSVSGRMTHSGAASAAGAARGAGRATTFLGQSARAWDHGNHDRRSGKARDTWKNATHQAIYDRQYNRPP